MNSNKRPIGEHFQFMHYENDCLIISLGDSQHEEKFVLSGEIKIKSRLRHWLGMHGTRLKNYYSKDNKISLEFDDGTTFLSNTTKQPKIIVSKESNPNFYLPAYKIFEGLTVTDASVDADTDNLLLGFDDGSGLCVFNTFELSSQESVSTIVGKKILEVMDDGLLFTMKFPLNNALTIDIKNRDPEAMIYSPAADLKIPYIVWN